MTALDDIRIDALRSRRNVSGLTFREWFDETGIIGLCKPNAWNQCTVQCGHSPVSASPESLQAWANGLHPREYGYLQMLKLPGTASLGGVAFYEENHVMAGVLYHAHPGGYWTAYCPFRESMVWYAAEFTD